MPLGWLLVRVAGQCYEKNRVQILRIRRDLQSHLSAQGERLAVIRLHLREFSGDHLAILGVRRCEMGIFAKVSKQVPRGLTTRPTDHANCSSRGSRTYSTLGKAELDHGADRAATTQGAQFDFGRILIHAPAQAQAIKSGSCNSASVDRAATHHKDVVLNQSIPTQPVQQATSRQGSSGAPGNPKRAGVDAFVVSWEKLYVDADCQKLQLVFFGSFMDDDAHDPTLAEFRQWVMSSAAVVDGPHKGVAASTPWHDDNYSRADDLAGNHRDWFFSGDQPSMCEFLDRNNNAVAITKDDIVDYSFTAEQRIVDTSNGNKIIANRGPHTATIRGKGPNRQFTGVPVILNNKNPR